MNDNMTGERTYNDEDKTTMEKKETYQCWNNQEYSHSLYRKRKNQPEHITQASLFSKEHISFSSSNFLSAWRFKAAANSGSISPVLPSRESGDTIVGDGEADNEGVTGSILTASTTEDANVVGECWVKATTRTTMQG